jgi:hypothetical protein
MADYLYVNAIGNDYRKRVIGFRRVMTFHYTTIANIALWLLFAIALMALYN